MQKKPKMGDMMGDLMQPSIPRLTLGQQLHLFTSTKSFKYTTRILLVAAAIFSIIKFGPTLLSDVDNFLDNRKAASYEDRFAQVMNYVLMDEYSAADSMITTLEREMKEERSLEINSLLETIVAYDKQEIDPILQRTATQQAAYLFQTQTQQAIDLSDLLTQQAFDLSRTQTQQALDSYLTQTEQAKPTLTPTFTLTPTITPTPTKTPTSTSTLTPTRTLTPIPSATKTPLPTQTKPAETSTPVGPLREHYYTSMGSGVFSSVEYSDGMAPVAESVTSGFYVQSINPKTVSGLCGTSQFTISKIWYSNSAASDVTVNGNVIGNALKTNSHGYLVSYNLNKGDTICFTSSQPGGFSFNISPNFSRLYTHYDSYCYRGHCN